MQQVAEQAGFTVGALYRHFPGKPDLLLAVVTSALEKIPLFQTGAAIAARLLGGRGRRLRDARSGDEPPPRPRGAHGRAA